MFFQFEGRPRAPSAHHADGVLELAQLVPGAAGPAGGFRHQLPLDSGLGGERGAESTTFCQRWCQSIHRRDCRCSYGKNVATNGQLYLKT